MSSLSALAETPAEYSAADAAKHAGENATVTDKVDDVHQAKGGNIFLNMGGRHPDNLFTIFIGASHKSEFPNFDQYKGATVSVTGKIEMHKEKPQIVVTSPSQITIKQPADSSQRP